MLLLDRDYKNVAKREIDTELYQKASSASLAEIKALVEAGANPDATVYNDIGDDFYAIHRAAMNPDLEVLKYFVSLGVNPCRMDFWAREPLSFAVRKNPIAHARYLVDLGNKADNCNHDGGTVIAEATFNPYIDVLDFLLENGADLNEGACGSLPLDMAVRKGSVERVKYFIEHGSRIDWVESYEIAFAPMENVRLLLEHGYDPNMMDEEEGTKVIDHLDPKRQALFREFGGVVLKPDAEKYYLTYPEEMPKE